jgi:hypothetical protein
MDDESNRLHRVRGSTPSPDPTILTTQALLREVSSLKEIIDTRLRAMDQAIEVRKNEVDRVKHESDGQVAALKDTIQALIVEKFNTINERFSTMDEKFEGIQTQFVERDERVKDSAIARDTAVAAALQAQKEAAFESKQSFEKGIDKSEKASGERVGQLQVFVEQGLRSLSDKIDDLKSRMDRGEGMGAGHSGAVAEHHTQVIDSRTLLFAVIGFILTATGIIVGVLLATR